MSFAIKIQNMPEVQRAFRRAPDRMAHWAKDGFLRGMLGFRKSFLRVITPIGYRRKSLHWIWRVKVLGKDLDSLEGRFYPIKFHASLGRFQRGGIVRPRRTKGFAITQPKFRKRAKGGGTTPLAGYHRPQRHKEKFGKKKRLVPFKTKRGNLALVEAKRRGRKGKRRYVLGEIAFVVVRQVRVRRGILVSKHWNTRPERTAFLRRVNQNIARGLREVFGRKAVA